jgi:hypothetical protein
MLLMCVEAQVVSSIIESEGEEKNAKKTEWQQDRCVVVLLPSSLRLLDLLKEFCPLFIKCQFPSGLFVCFIIAFFFFFFAFLIYLSLGGCCGDQASLLFEGCEWFACDCIA